MSIGGVTFLGVASAVYSHAAGAATALANAWNNAVAKLESHPWVTHGGLFATPPLDANNHRAIGNLRFGETYQIVDSFRGRLHSRNVAIHPNQSGVILVNYPGLGGAIDGYKGKHQRLAEHIAQSGLAAVVRMDNPRNWEHGPLSDDEYKEFLIQGLRSVVQYAKAHANEICGREEYRLWLMGFSAGASAIAVLAQELGAEKILLMAPARTAGESAVLSGIETFPGDVAIVHGENDSIVPLSFSESLFQTASSARSRRRVVLPDCDHQFQGTVNGQIMSKAPLWAFGSDSSFPSPEGGLILY